MDSNSNSICDPGEVQTITNGDGSYSMQVTDTSGVILVEVPSEAVDLDTGRTIGGHGYALKAPVSAQGFISPISTIVQAHVDAGMTYDEALSKVATDFRVPLNNKEIILEDFIDRQVGGADSALKKSLHKKAVLTATVARERVQEYYTKPGTLLTEEGRSDALNQIINELAGLAPEISTKAESEESIGSLRLTTAFDTLKSENPFSFSTGFGNIVGNAWYSTCSDEFPTNQAGYQFGYYKYSFLSSGLLKATHYYFRNEAVGDDAISSCLSRSTEGYTSTKVLFNYSFDKPLSDVDETFITLNYIKENYDGLTRDVPSYLKAKKFGDYLCFGANEGSFTDVTLDGERAVSVDQKPYSALKTLRLAAKTVASDSYSTAVDASTIAHCLMK